jgi:hypothetical protein
MRGIARLLALTDLAQLLVRLEVALVESDDASAIADTVRATTELLERQPLSASR